MQNYAISSEKSNVFSQFSSWRNRAAKELTNKEVNKIVRLRNDKTHADEALWIIRVLLFIVTMFTAYCGFLFYQSTFGHIFSPTATMLAALAFAVCTEMAKIFLAHRALRSIFFGWMFKTFWNLGGWIFISALGIGAFIWSVNISTDGMNMLTREITENTTPRGDIAAEVSAATNAIDQQIAEATAAQKKALGITWKGNTTVEGQRIAKSSARQIEALQAQRLKILDQVTADHQQYSATRRENISNWAYWIERYGGYMELVAALCLFSIVFFERRLVAENIASAANIPDPDTLNQSPTPSPTPGAPRHNGGYPSSSYSSLTGNAAFRNDLKNPVRDLGALSGKNISSASQKDGDFLRLRLKRLKGWDDNFNKPGNNSDTVAENMTRLLNEIGKQLQQPDFNPDTDAIQDLLVYITKTGFPVMRANGYEYQYADDMRRLCENRLPMEAAA